MLFVGRLLEWSIILFLYGSNHDYFGRDNKIFLFIIVTDLYKVLLV